jgi:hypothetical protein
MAHESVATQGPLFLKQDRLLHTHKHTFFFLQISMGNKHVITHTWRGKGRDLTYASHRGVPAQCHEIVLFHPGTRFQVSRVCVKRQRSKILNEHASDFTPDT